MGSSDVPTYTRPCIACASPTTNATATTAVLATSVTTDRHSVPRSHHAVAAITKNTSVNNWGNAGLPGQQATPILQTAIGNTTDSTLAAQLLLGQAGGAANGIATNSGRIGNLTAATSTACGGKPCPVNLFVVNPTVASGGSFVETNDGASFYDALQVELRRRLSHGISLQSSYVWSKSLANGPTNSSSSVSQPTTLRNLGIDKVPSGFDVTAPLSIR